MNCREAERHIFAERDGALDDSHRAALDGHVAGCATCRRVREQFALAFASLRGATAQVRVPDADLEWQKLRREIHGGAGSRAAARRSPLAWFALPMAAAAAVVLALFVNSPGTSPVPVEKVPAVAKATAIESASTVVFVDDRSGYVFVWADPTKQI